MAISCTSTRPATGLGIPGQSMVVNPASQYCLEQGGISEIRPDALGNQMGFCKFTDNSECEEFALLKGDCLPGQNKIQ